MEVTIQSEVGVQVNESAGFVEICVNASRQSQTTYEVVLRTEDDTATGNSLENVIWTLALMIGIYFIGGEDYVSVEKSLLFSFGFDLTQCVNIPILTDDCLEQTESFNVSLSADHLGVNFDVDEIVVSILEDDGNWLTVKCKRGRSPVLHFMQQQRWDLNSWSTH